MTSYDAILLSINTPGISLPEKEMLIETLSTLKEIQLQAEKFHLTSLSEWIDLEFNKLYKIMHAKAKAIEKIKLPIPSKEDLNSTELWNPNKG